jgi:phospholipid/cholesterol/gamma-HCH transport system substrate-binding protein
VILSRVNSILAQLDEALGPGTDASEIGKIVGSIQTALAGAEGIPESADRMIRDIQAQLRPILANVNTLITELNDPGGLLYTVLDTDREVYTSMVKSLNSASGLLDNLDRTTAFIPGQLPQIAGLIMDLRVTLKSVEDVLIALTNNPLLRKGVPDRLETHDSGTSPRDIRF